MSKLIKKSKKILVKLTNIFNPLRLSSTNNNLDYQRDILQAQILTEDSLESRTKFWNLMKKTQNNDHSWLRFLNEACSVSYVTVTPEKSSSLFLNSNFGEPIPLHLLLDPGVGLKALLTKQYDPSNIEFFYSQAVKNKSTPITVIDIGANIGLFSRQCFARLSSQLEALYAYEPDPAIFPLLTKNLSGIDNAKLMNSGIGDVSGKLDFFIDQKHPSSSSLLKSSLPDEYYNVNKTSVDVLAAKEESRNWLSHEGILFYKSDTQGYDQIIAVALGIEFFKQVNAAIIEIFPYSGEDGSLLEKFSSIVNIFPFKASLQNPHLLFSTEQAIAEIKSGNGFDLILWR